MKVLFFLMQLYYRKILVNAKYWIGTRYGHLLNIKELGSGLKNLIKIPNSHG